MIIKPIIWLSYPPLSQSSMQSMNRCCDKRFKRKFKKQRKSCYGMSIVLSYLKKSYKSTFWKSFNSTVSMSRELKRRQQSLHSNSKKFHLTCNRNFNKSNRSFPNNGPASAVTQRMTKLFLNFSNQKPSCRLMRKKTSPQRKAENNKTSK